MNTAPSVKAVPSNWEIYMSVGDVDSNMKPAGTPGGKVGVPLQGIRNVGRFSVNQNPQGAVISLITYRK